MSILRKMNKMNSVEEFEKFVNENFEYRRISVGAQWLNLNKFGYYQVPLAICEYLYEYCDGYPYSITLIKAAFVGTKEAKYIRMDLSNVDKNYNVDKVEKRLLNVRNKISRYVKDVDSYSRMLEEKEYCKRNKIDTNKVIDKIDKIEEKIVKANKEIEQTIREYAKQLKIEFRK